MATSAQIHVELVKATLTYGHEALKTAMWINGGAAVAVLGFLSAASTKAEASAAMLANLPLSLLFFAIGTLTAAIAVGVTYLSQGFFALARNRIAEVLRGFAFVLVIVSYAMFMWGAVQAYAAFS